MISKISQNLTRCMDKATLFSMKGMALAGSVLSFQQCMFAIAAANQAITTETNQSSQEVKLTEIDPLTQHALAGSAFALTSIALGRFAFLSKIQF